MSSQKSIVAGGKGEIKDYKSTITIVETHKFSDIFSFQKKSKIKAGDGLQNGLYPFFTSSPYLTKSYNEAQFDEESLIFGTGGLPSIHFCNKPFAVSTDCLVVQPKMKMEVKFVYYFLLINIWILENGFKGAGLKHISKSYISDIDIPLPTLEEQKRIVRILDQADSLRRKRQKAISLLDDYLKVVFLEMFGDPVTNPKGWKIKSLKEITSKIGSGATPRGGKNAYKTQGISLIRSLNIHDNKFLYKNLAFIDDNQAVALSNVTVEPEDILLNITGASVCRCAMVDYSILPARVNQHVAILRPRKSILNPRYFLHLIISHTLKQKLLRTATAGGATREALTKQQIEQFEVPIPPIELQEKFSLICGLLGKIKQSMYSQSAELNTNFNALMQGAFNQNYYDRSKNRIVETIIL